MVPRKRACVREHALDCARQGHHQPDLANAIFWGLWLFPFGLVLYKSRFLPRFLFPAHEDEVFSAIQPVVLGEVATLLWLLIMGAKEKRSTAVAAGKAAGAPVSTRGVGYRC